MATAMAAVEGAMELSECVLRDAIPTHPPSKDHIVALNIEYEIRH